MGATGIGVGVGCCTGVVARGVGVGGNGVGAGNCGDVGTGVWRVDVALGAGTVVVGVGAEAIGVGVERGLLWAVTVNSAERVLAATIVAVGASTAWIEMPQPASTMASASTVAIARHQLPGGRERRGFWPVFTRHLPRRGAR